MCDQQNLLELNWTLLIRTELNLIELNISLENVCLVIFILRVVWNVNIKCNVMERGSDKRGVRLRVWAVIIYCLV